MEAELVYHEKKYFEDGSIQEVKISLQISKS
jgi:hypothetical protein